MFISHAGKPGCNAQRSHQCDFVVMLPAEGNVCFLCAERVRIFSSASDFSIELKIIGAISFSQKVSAFKMCHEKCTCN